MRLIALSLVTALATAGCGILYKVDVYQGNLLDERNVEQLQTGMNKRQVMTLLDSPSIRDPFNQHRWDYAATISRDGDDPEIKNLVLTFEGDTLASIDGDYFPKQDERLRRDMGRYGNLPRDEDTRRGRASR
jgi:outer membrane protein assembly factor BamE